MKRSALLTLSCLVGNACLADVVNVYERTDVGGAIVQIGERAFETGRNYTTVSAPAKSGSVFTHWTISTTQAFENRDEWGRALDQVSFVVYEGTTLTAHYVPKTLDADGDGVADGFELYWYGNLGQSATSDTDGDGKTFAEELAAGTNPLMAESADAGPIAWGAGVVWLFNPNNYGAVTIRSEPEGALFATSSEVYRPGTRVSTTSKGTYAPETTSFAYWSFNGERIADEWGRAEPEKTVVTDGSPLTIVAYAASDYETRMKLYWYGRTDVAMSSDTDGDGKTFAEELAAGRNPLMAESADEGPVKTADGVLWQYNPYNYQPYTIKSEPEGALFPTESRYVRAGDKVVVTAPGATFYGWQVNGGEIRRDEWGRSEETFSFNMPSEAVTLVAKTASDYETRMKLYWYGRTDVAMSSDTDGDGKTFAEELAAGTNPLMAESADEGPVKYSDTVLTEFNLQPYEQMQGTLVDGNYVQLFHSPIAGNAGAVSFGSAVTPVVADLNNDGRFDLVVLTATATNVYLNVGSSGNPEFEIRTDVDLTSVDLAMNATAKLASFTLDVPATGALSATTNGTELLVSDADGRIWYYTANRAIEQSEQSNNLPIGQSPNRTIEQSEQSNNSYSLQHKVWGGSYAGFANGLRLAAVDWEDDGDLDCLCGTAEGKLMLLRNPKVGRPTNLAALAGVDSVQLSWDPNAQSRIRGYKVYRQSEELRVQSAELFELLASPPLPFYRDTPSIVAAYNYRVTSVSRFYTAGNSTPIESESMPTEAVRAVLGAPTFTIGEPVRTAEGTIEITVSINNSLHYRAAGTEIRVPYNVTDLVYASTRPSGLSEKLVYHTTTAGGVATIAIASGEVEPGSGAFFTLVFHGTADAVLKGDLDGDGKLTVADLRELAKLKSAAGRKYTDVQLKAGDLNGNGKLDEADYQALRALLKAQGI